MSKKVRKTLYLPEWITEILDKESETIGPGVVVAASINAFDEMDKTNKKSLLKRFRDKEIDMAYGPNDAKQAKAKIAPKKHKQKFIHKKIGAKPIHTESY